MLRHGDPHGYRDTMGYLEPVDYRDPMDYVDPADYREPLPYREPLHLREPIDYLDPIDPRDPIAYRDPLRHREPIGRRDLIPHHGPRESIGHHDPVGHRDPIGHRMPGGPRDPITDRDPAARRAGVGPPGPGRLGSKTNSDDFASKDSRVFVGNLNTIALGREDVAAIFGPLGQVTAISMHKGYAFVQYSHPGEARRAVAFENGKTYAGQAIDLNIVSEPKKGTQKRRAGPPPPDNLDRRGPEGMSSSVPPEAKRPRQDVNASLHRGNLVTLGDGNRPPSSNFTPRFASRPAPRPTSQLTARPAPKPAPRSGPAALSASRVAAAAVIKRATTTVSKATTNSTVSKTANNTGNMARSAATGTGDVLICGQCKRHFSNLHSLAQHKKVPCRLSLAACKCRTNPPEVPENPEPAKLQCAECEKECSTAWDLCQHCQTEHKVSIYRTTKDGC